MPDINLARQWLSYAEDDINTARHMQSFHKIPIGIICYHCQQTAEKALKSLLACRNVEIPRTHDLGFIYTLCIKNGYVLPNFCDKLAVLTDYVVNTRYPSNIELDENEMKMAIEYAGEILKICIDIINLENGIIAE